MGRLRRPMLYGWSLYNHMYNLTRIKGAFTPPVWFEAMQKVPPQHFKRRTRPPPLEFPSIKLREKMELQSEHARTLMKQGMAYLASWFERRPIEEAVAEVQLILRDNPDWTEEQAISHWDTLMDKRLELREREKQIIREDAVRASEAPLQNNGVNIVTAIDSLQMLQAFRDMQMESNANRLIKMDQVSRRASATLATEKIVTDQDGSTPFLAPSVSAEKQQHFQANFAQFVEKHFNVKYEREKKQVLEFKKQLDIEKARLKLLNAENRLNPTMLRKLAQALEIQEQILHIMHLKETYGPPDLVFTNGTHITPYDFLSVYIKAFEINNIGATASGWGKDRLIYEDAEVVENEEYNEEEGDEEVETVPLYDVLKKEYGIFKNLFRRYMRMEVVDLNVSGYLHSINLGLSMSKDKPVFEDIGPYESPLAAFPVQKVNLTPILNELQQYNWGNFHKMKEHQGAIEELFNHLHVCKLLGRRSITQHTPMYTPMERSDDLALAEQQKQSALNLFSVAKKPETTPNANAEIFKTLFTMMGDPKQ